MEYSVGYHISKPLFLSRLVNPLISFTVYILSTSRIKRTELREIGETTSTYDCNISRGRVDHLDLGSPSIEEENGSKSSDPVATQHLHFLTKAEWLDICVDLIKAFKNYRGWKCIWYLSSQDLKIKQHEDEYQQTKTGILALRTQLHLFNEQLQSIPHCATENFGQRTNSGAISALDELENLRAEIGRLKKLTRELKTKATFSLDLSSATWKTDSRIKRHVEQEVSEAKAAVAKFLFPLVEIGKAVRNRFMEQCSTRNKDIIILGNKAAHYGKPLADVLLYHPNNSEKRQDQATFVKIYGFKPEEIWMLSGCTQLMEMVFWYSSIKSWYPNSFERQDFSLSWPKDLFKKYGEAKLEAVKADLKTAEQVALFKKLKTKYLAEAAANKLQHSPR
jgi:hypothetical protein